MSVDVVTEVTRLWAELGKGLDSLDAGSPEARLEQFLDRVVVLGGVERQTVYPGLEELDDGSDAATKTAVRRWERIQSAIEKLRFPLSADAWQAFAGTLSDHLDKSPKDIGARLEALSEEDRADLGERTRVMRERLS